MNKLLPILLFLFVASGCSESDDYSDLDPVASPIELVGTFAGVELDTRAPINPGEAADISILRADQSLTASTFGAYALATHGAITASSGAITFVDTQYYLPNPTKKSKLVGIHPRTTATNVSWTDGGSTIVFDKLDGNTDVLCSAVAGGSKGGITTMTFSHLLAQLEVSVKCQFITPDLWGKIKSITLSGAKSGVTVTLPPPDNSTTAVPSASSGLAKNYVLEKEKSDSDVLTTSTKVYGRTMFPPVTADDQLTLTVVTEKNTFAAKNLTLQKYEASKKYQLTISFTATEISISSSTIAPWTDVPSGIIEL